MASRLLWLALAGAAGTLCRFGLQGAVAQLLGLGFPWGTLCVNLLGSFGVGLFWAFAVSRPELSSELRLSVLVGFFGGFTTFSSFAFETAHLLRAGAYGLAATNIFLQNVLGVACFFAGAACFSRAA